MSGRAAIVGIGHTAYTRESGRTELALAVEASLAAIVDAGLSAAAIDGLVTFAIDATAETDLVRTLGTGDITFATRVPFGGGAACGVLAQAAMAVTTGAAKHVLVWRAANFRSGHRYGQPQSQVRVAGWPAPNLYLPFGLTTIGQQLALQFQRWMDAYGVTNTDCGRYSVVARRHAASNPDAVCHGQPITLADHDTSRWIVEPVLRLLDCCQETDGGTALVLASADEARDLPQPVVDVLAATQGMGPGSEVGTSYYHGDLSGDRELGIVANKLWHDSGLTPADIDVALLYDHFSPGVLMQLEELGFCGRGESKEFVADGGIEIGGALPVNTHGGMLGEAYMNGVNGALEAVRQLRGTAVNQVTHARHAIVTSGWAGVLLRADE